MLAAAGTAENDVGPTIVRDLMEKAGVTSKEELDKAQQVFEAVKDFIENTGFSAPLHRRPKY